MVNSLPGVRDVLGDCQWSLKKVEIPPITWTNYPEFSGLIKLHPWLERPSTQPVKSANWAPCLIPFDITVTSWWAQWLLKSAVSRLFTQPFVEAQIKENIKAPRHWPLWGESIGHCEFPTQRASHAENVSIWWRHHGRSYSQQACTVNKETSLDSKQGNAHLEKK